MTSDNTEAQNALSLDGDEAVREELSRAGRDGVAEVTRQHPDSPLAWVELADIASSEQRHLDAYAYATVAADLARQRFAADGWVAGEPVAWNTEHNRPYHRALHTARRAAVALGLTGAASALAADLESADVDASSRIDSEFTPTQVITIITPELEAAFLAETVAVIASPDEDAAPVASPDADRGD
ncbi:DUF3151 family protein [Agromyces atrinae]|uniref:DUF3151 family protein n=1 Tax=Agromyces atrinae TaxID=592376 RepID=UPI001F584275|nr:DUF3151 family protein [Agromyces atrinae]MCI2956459.1 DUF3151 family protein [Agromyces atrinae]